MRVLLTSNASYAPPKGGSTRSNLVWLEHLAKSGHHCRVVCSADGNDPADTIVPGDHLEIRTVRDLGRHADVLRRDIEQFRPEWVLVSSEDVSHTLLRSAFAAAPDRLVYLAHTPQWYPFGPASWHADRRATEIVTHCRAVVAIADTTAAYIREHAGVHAEVLHPPIYGSPPWPCCGDFDHGFVLMINPCIVKGIEIFLELARRFPSVPFAALAGWGTTSSDRHSMSLLPNVRVLESVAGVEEALCQAKLLLAPSLWYEGFGLVVMEAMLHGLPVVASDSGGLVEAKAGTGYVIPVQLIERFEAAFDEAHMPRPVSVAQDIEPWAAALRRLLEDAEEYRKESQRSRDVAHGFVSRLRAGEFEELLTRLTHAEAEAPRSSAASALTPAQRALLLRRLREKP